MRILIDTNIFLDVIQRRESFGDNDFCKNLSIEQP